MALFRLAVWMVAVMNGMVGVTDALFACCVESFSSNFLQLVRNSFVDSVHMRSHAFDAGETLHTVCAQVRFLYKQNKFVEAVIDHFGFSWLSMWVEQVVFFDSAACWVAQFKKLK